jgi:hypothetical protein
MHVASRSLLRPLAALAVGAAVLLCPASASADPQPSPADFRTTSVGLDLGVPCQVRASIFVDNGHVPDGDPASRVTAYYQMETRPDDGRGSYYWDDWADWDQAAARRQGSWNEFDLYRQDVSPVSFERGYVGPARRWEGAMGAPTGVPPTNLPYSVWSYGFKTFGPGGQREDWRVVRDRSTNGGPPGSTDNLVSTVRKTDVPAQPLPTEVRAGTAPGAPDSGIVRVVGSDGVARAWTSASDVTFALTGLDGGCASWNRPEQAPRDAATNPACVPDPVTFDRCWQHAVAANSSPSGTLDYHADGAYGPSPYCSHLAGQMVVYQRADRSDCPSKLTLQQYRDRGVLPSWWCSAKTAFGFCVESQVDWIPGRQQPVWMQAVDQSSGVENHALMTSWYGEPQGNVSRNACPRRADGSAQLGNPRVCFYEGWWRGEIHVPLEQDGRHPIAVETVDGTFASWLKGAPANVQNRSGGTTVVHRDIVGPLVAGAMDAVAQNGSIRFAATGVQDRGGVDEAIGVNPADVWMYACRRQSAGCDAGSIPETGDGDDRLSMRMTMDGKGAFAVTASGVADGEWFWKVVPYDLLANRGQERTGALFRVLRVEATADVATVQSGGAVDVDVTANDLWTPHDAPTTVTVVGQPARGTATLVARAGQLPLLRYRSAAGTPAGSADTVTYRLCASASRSSACSEAAVRIDVRAASVRRPT